MDPEASVLLHCPHGLQEHQVQVEISTRFNRRSIPEVEEHIAAVWNARVTKDPWLFNGAKFRLHSAHFSMAHPDTANCYHMAGETITQTSEAAKNDKQPVNPQAQKPIPACLDDQDKLKDVQISSDLRAKKSSCCRETSEALQKSTSVVSLKNASEQKQVILCLKLGLTWYKDFLGINWSNKAASLEERGKLEFGDTQALLAQPLGVGAVMITSDEQVVMLRRSQRVAEAAGLLDIPGGHPEPKAVCQGVNEEAISVELMLGCERSIVAEIFSSVCAEIRDEVNVPLSVLSTPLLMGIALNHTSAGRPSAEFFVRCSLTMKEVKDLYLQEGPEAHESTDIMFLSRKEMLHLDERSYLWPELCPSAKGAVLLYQLVQPDQP